MRGPDPARRPARALFALIVACGALAACAPLPPVRAWEKGDLAKPSMTFDADRLEARMLEQVYFSKEASSGGAGVGGGGCGCN